MNEGNLRPIGKDDRSKSEVREIQSRGGKHSGESRRRKRDQRQLMTTMLKAVPDLDPKAVDNFKRLGIQGKGEKKDQYTIETIGMAALLQKVMKGDTRAYRLMLEILGEDAYSQREAERLRHEREMQETPPENPETNDGFVEMLSDIAGEVFENGMDEPANTDD